eukprot:m.228737 g.228737  ORF g.228737 m.228737 type:complete len:2030 (+) comp33545_c0_seq2:117-6206(+)
MGTTPVRVRPSDPNENNNMTELKTISALGGIRLLLWKNFIIQRRRPKVTICELLFPALLISIIAVIRPLFPSDDFGERLMCPRTVSFADAGMDVFVAGNQSHGPSGELWENERMYRNADGLAPQRTPSLISKTPMDTSFSTFPTYTNSDNTYSVFESTCYQFSSAYPDDSGTDAQVVFNQWRGWRGLNKLVHQNNFLSDNITARYDTIAFYPNTSKVREAISHVESYLKGFLVELGENGVQPAADFEFMAVNSIAEFDTIVDEQQYRLLAGIVFEDKEGNSGLPAQGDTGDLEFTYQIRMAADIPVVRWNNLSPWGTAQEFPLFDSTQIPDEENLPYVNDGPTKMDTGFLMLQTLIDQALAKIYHKNKKIPQAIPRLQPFPYPNFEDQSFNRGTSNFMPLLIVFSFIVPVASIARYLVEEKQSRMKEAMKMMGLPGWVNWVSWFLKSWIFMTIPTIIIVIIIKAGEILQYTDGVALFVLFQFFLIANIALAFLVSTVFKSAENAMYGAGFAYFLTYMWFLNVGSSEDGYNALTPTDKFGMCFLPTSCFGVAVQIIVRYEGRGDGMQFSNIGEAPTDGDPFGLSNVIGGLFLDALLFFALTWYITNTYPGEFGSARPHMWFLRPSFWYPPKLDMATEKPEVELASEPLAANAKLGVQIQNLRKVWITPAGPKIAVQNLSLDLVEGDVTVLLGENGAGKTTAMSMLTGMYRPTSGDAFINGHSVSSETNVARSSLGLCPQFDILFDTLTVREHLIFFAKLKGMTDSKAIKAECDKFIDAIDLSEKHNALAQTLSGGQKRALSTAIAFVGGSKTVILDEPTSGMDPAKRRHTWDLIQKLKTEGRTILLTTHFMDEADLLGDRIAIMRLGQLRCVGTPLFLKRQFGCGYHMTIGKHSTCKMATIMDLVKKHAPNAVLEEDIGAQATVQLPKEASKTFGKLFGELEEQKDALGIESCGASVTTMEDVFMKILSETGAEKLETREPEELLPKAKVSVSKDEFATGNALMLQQIRAVFVKRFRHFLRNKQQVVVQLLLPLVFVLISVSSTKTSGVTPDKTESCRTFDFEGYKDPINVYASMTDTGYGTAPMSHAEGKEYYISDSNTLNQNRGSLDPTPAQIKIFSDISAFCAEGAKCTFVNETGKNLTEVLLNESRSFRATQWFRKTPAAFSTAEGAMWIDSSCNVRVGDNYTRLASLNLAVNVPYTFIMHYPDFMTTEDLSLVEGFQVEHPANGTRTKVDVLGANVDVRFELDNTTRSSRVLVEVIDGVAVWEAPIDPVSGASRTLSLVGRELSDSSNTTIVCGNQTIELKFTSAADRTRSTATTVTAYHNIKSYHALPESLRLANERITSSHLGRNVKLTTKSCPLKKTPKMIAQQGDGGVVTGLKSNMLLAATFILGAIIQFPVKEDHTRSRHIQFVSGLGPKAYWVGNWLWDGILSLISIGLFMVLFAAFDLDGYKEDNNMGALFVVLLLFFWAAIPWMYVWALVCRAGNLGPSSAFGISFLLNWFVVLALDLVRDILPAVEQDLRLDGTAESFDYYFSIHPVYAMVRSVGNIYTNWNLKTSLCADSPQFCASQNYLPQDNVMNTHIQVGVGYHCIYLAIEGVVFWLLIFLLEWSSARKTASATAQGGSDNDLDDDVVDEQHRVSAGISNTDEAVVVDRIVKTYGSGATQKKAVQGMSFGIPHGECFGLLGVNGAGKTTSFRMLTGEVSMTSGAAKINGFDVATQSSQARQSMGYCPQYDGLIPELTGEETLTLFANIRGLKPTKIKKAVDEAITLLSLTEHSKRLAGTYSGGNKRKLSAAIALMGDPSVIFLDEPTSGMDVGSRRFLWDALLQTLSDGKTIVLTTHSMEEVEALCSRVGIMVNGQFKCFGTIQHLKSKFGDGYMLTVQLKPETAAESFTEYFTNRISGTSILSTHDTQITYKIDKTSSMSTLFEIMEDEATARNIVDYSLSQTSLEQIFLTFAAEQETEEMDEEKKLAKKQSGSCGGKKDKTEPEVPRKASLDGETTTPPQQPDTATRPTPDAEFLKVTLI